MCQYSNLYICWHLKKYYCCYCCYILLLLLLATKFLQIIYFFSTSNLIEIKQLQFLLPTIELAKLNMRKDYVSLTFIKSKIKQIRIFHKDKLCWHQTHTTQNILCNFNNHKTHLKILLFTQSRQVGFALSIIKLR